MSSSTAPCLVCGQRPHDGAYHDEFRRRLRRWVNLLDSRYPALKGRGGYPPSDPPLRAEKGAEKASKIKGPYRLRHRVSPVPDFLKSITRKKGPGRGLVDVPGTVAWCRLQEHLALDAPLRAVRGRAPVTEAEG